MEQLSKLKIAQAIFVIIAIVGQFLLVAFLHKDNIRLKDNQSSLLSSIDVYKTDSMRNAVSIAQLRLTAQELSQSNLSLKADIEELNIKLKRVNSASSVSLKSEYIVKTVVRDSIVFRDSIVYRYPCLNYETPYVILNGCVVSDSLFEGSINTFNSLIRVEHRVPKKFLFFRFGTKLVKEEYLSKNPHTTITNVETVVIVDKKGKRKDK